MATAFDNRLGNSARCQSASDDGKTCKNNSVLLPSNAPAPPSTSLPIQPHRYWAQRSTAKCLTAALHSHDLSRGDIRTRYVDIALYVI